MSETEQFWKQEFGNQYHLRNRVDWRARMPFWDSILRTTGARTIFEVGCGPGWNLTACMAVACARNMPLQTYGTEINQLARRQARLAGHRIQLERVEHPQNPLSAYDLAMSVGCLIHVPPAELEATMRGIVNISAQYVLSVEYESVKEEMIEYRGNQDRLWRRPYGEIYQGMGLKPIDNGRLLPSEGFDNCAWMLLEK